MRAFTILSSAALLTLAAASANAQSSSNPSASPPPSASTSQQSDRGYDSRAEKHQARESDRPSAVVPDYAQTRKHHSGNNAGYLVPFGPPA